MLIYRHYIVSSLSSSEISYLENLFKNLKQVDINANKINYSPHFVINTLGWHRFTRRHSRAKFSKHLYKPRGSWGTSLLGWHQCQSHEKICLIGNSHFAKILLEGWLHKWIKDARLQRAYGMRYKLSWTTLFMAPLPILKPSKKRYVIMHYTSCTMNQHITFIEGWNIGRLAMSGECVPHIICWPSPHVMGKQLYKPKLRDHYFLATSSIYKYCVFKANIY